MKYDYECQDCGAVTEVQCSMSDYRPEIKCPGCESIATRVFDVPRVIVKGNQRDIKLDALDVPIGWHHGNVDCEANERRYAKIINAERKEAQANDKAAIKNGIRKIGTVPRELYKKRQRQYGRDYWNDDQKTKLKEEGLYFHKD